MKRQKPIVGDIFEFELSNGRKIYVYYVFWDKQWGPLVQLYDLIDAKTASLNQLRNSKPLFPAVIVGLFAAARTGLWKKIGHQPIENFIYPGFISTFHDKRGKATIWFLWDGEKSIRLGHVLPDEYKDKEYLCVWSLGGLIRRIETGENQYHKLINTNVID